MRPPVRARVAAGLLAAALVPLACGGSEPAGSEPSSQEGSGGPAEVPWDRLPVTDRALDPELTPPEVIAGLGDGRIFVANADEWDPGTTFRLQTDLGISLQVDLAAGFSDGYVVLTPPESPWLLQVGDEDEDTWTTVAEVPVARRTETGAIAVELTRDGAVVEPIPVAEFEQRVDAAAVHLPSG